MSRLVPSRLLMRVIVSTTLLSVATLVALHSQSVKTAALPPDPARQVAEELDALVQPRFQDPLAGVFGTGRVISPVRGHVEAVMFQYLSPLRSKFPREVGLLKQANATHRDYIVAFLHCAHVPGKFKDFPPKDSPTHDPYAPPQASLSILAVSPSVSLAWQSAWKNLKQRPQAKKSFDAQKNAFQKAALADLPRLQRGQSQEASVSHWLVILRPVRALQDSCLGCHTGAKRGDTLGVMVYAVDKTR